jgi:hypothetical protein
MTMNSAGRKGAGTPDWLAPAIMLVAGAEILLGLYFLYSAATTWTSLPVNPLAIAYFAVTLLGIPLLAVWSFALAYREEQLSLAAILAAIPLALYVLRYFLFAAA